MTESNADPKPLTRELRATYLIETAYDVEQAALIMAGEQSCGTFLRTPGESDLLREYHSAAVEHIEVLGTVDRPSLPGARHPVDRDSIVQAKVTLSWPLSNVGLHLSNVAATVAGNLFELAPFSALRLLDLHLPADFATRYPGPRWGIGGTRRLCGVLEGPVVGTIIKPSVGLSPEATAAQTKVLVEAGLDFLKDDELMGDPPHAPFVQRVEAVMAVLHRHADRTGRLPMFAFNLSGDLDEMLRRHDFLVEQGGTCAMVNINWVGLSAVIHLGRYTQLPLHGHRNGWGLFSRSPAIGIGFNAYQKFWRLAGIDHMHTNGIRNKFCEDDQTVVESIKTCLSPFIGTPSPMPVLSSGQWAGQVEDTYRAIGSTDLMYLCGGGIVAHPMGMAAGVASVRQAWEAAVQGVPLQQFAATHAELSVALDFFDKI